MNLRVKIHSGEPLTPALSPSDGARGINAEKVRWKLFVSTVAGDIAAGRRPALRWEAGAEKCERVWSVEAFSLPVNLRVKNG